jgi:hypothetical protein
MGESRGWLKATTPPVATAVVYLLPFSRVGRYHALRLDRSHVIRLSGAAFCRLRRVLHYLTLCMGVPQFFVCGQCEVRRSCRCGDYADE